MQMFHPYTLALLLLTPISGAFAQTDLFGYDAKASHDFQQKMLEERDGIKIFDASYARSKEGRIPVYIKMVIDLRRALDLMLARSDVDKNRIGNVGHSYGAMLGGILAAVERGMIQPSLLRMKSASCAKDRAI